MLTKVVLLLSTSLLHPLLFHPWNKSKPSPQSKTQSFLFIKMLKSVMLLYIKKDPNMKVYEGKRSWMMFVSDNVEVGGKPCVKRKKMP